MIKKVLKAIMKRKIASFILLIILVGGGYLGYKKFFSKTEEVRYVVDLVKKGTLITSVSGSGQISASNQVDVKTKASGNVLSIAVHDGQEMKKDDVLATIDARDAQKAVRDAQVNLESARISLKKIIQQPDAYALLQAENSVKTAKSTLDKLLKPADEDVLLQAENSVISARDALEKLKLSQPDDYQNMTETKKKAEDNFAKAYDDAFNTMANSFVGLSTPMTALYDILYSNQIGTSETTVGSGSWNLSAFMNTTVQAEGRIKLQALEDTAEASYKTANAKYIDTLNDYKKTTRYSNREAIDALLVQAIDMTKAISQAEKSENDLLSAWSDLRTQSGSTVFAKVNTYQTNLSAYISQANTNLSNLLSAQRTIRDNREAITSAERSLNQMNQNNPLDLSAAEASLKQKESALTKLKAGADLLDIANARASLKEKESALAKLKAGADAVDIQSQKLTIQQRENTLLDMREKLSDYTVKAPFDGIVAKINIKEGDPVSPSTAIATFITKQRTADISLNEVDVAKVKIGQKATLTFDAIGDLTITGEVAEIDTIGTVSQGVVTYNVKIIFDTQDERVKPGMSINTSIVTNIHEDVLMVSNSALKMRGGSQQIIQVFDTPLRRHGQGGQGILSQKPPRDVQVEVGLSNDTSAEILSGVKDGDQIVIRTITKTAPTTATQAPSIFGNTGAGARNFGGGGNARSITR